MIKIPEMPKGFGKNVAIGAGLGAIAGGIYGPLVLNHDFIYTQGALAFALGVWPVKLATVGGLYGAGRAVRQANGENTKDRPALTAAIAGGGLALAESYINYVGSRVTQNMPVDMNPGILAVVGVGSLIFYGLPNAAAYALGRWGGIEDAAKPLMKNFRDRLPRV